MNGRGIFPARMSVSKKVFFDTLSNENRFAGFSFEGAGSLLRA